MTSVTIDDLFLLVLNACTHLSRRNRNDILQNLAYKLEEWYNLSRDELRTHLAKIGFRLEERCVMCNEEMPTFDGIGDPLCNDCDSEADSVS